MDKNQIISGLTHMLKEYDDERRKNDERQQQLIKSLQNQLYASRTSANHWRKKYMELKNSEVNT
jgi:hypothetical protein